MKVTMEDIARMAGVSKATVSRVVNGVREGVGAETRAKILKIIQETNYCTYNIPHQVQMTKTLGLIIPDIINPFFGELAKAVERYSTEQGYTVLFGNTDFSKEKESKYLSIFSAKKVDGIILVTTEQVASERHKLLARYGIPCVLVDRTLTGMDYVSGIFLDNSYALFVSCSHLITHGNERIALISGPKNISTSVERVQGYRDALTQYQIPFEQRLIKYGDYTFESGYKAVMELEREGVAFTGVLAMNDTMALGAMQALKELTYRIPEDVEVIGFDNIGFSQLYDPPLTTIQQPTIEMGRRAAEILIRAIQGESESEKCIRLQPRLVVRKSTKNMAAVQQNTDPVAARPENGTRWQPGWN